jgi:ERCC4-related helicase
MSTKFFNNDNGNTLFEKLSGIAHEMTSFNRFLAVAGYFRSSGYFKLRKELGDVEEIKILVGINIDDIFRKHNKSLLMLGNEEKAKEVYQSDFKNDIINAKYTPEIEQGLLQMCDDLSSGRLQMKIHATKNLHAKFYLCLPKELTPNTDGWVIMGSSNISDSGLGISQAPRYELNVAMKDFDDVNYCKEEFDKLWEEAIPLDLSDIESYKSATYLGYQPTPYEIYMKVLIDTFGDQVEDDFNIQLPDGVKDLKYQKDAVIQGYQIMMKHNGLILADVVGLGKTMIATMIAKRFIEANGMNTNVLVIYPPAIEENWKNTFKLFGIRKKAQFITNGSLSKVLDGKNQYKDPEDFDLIIVDEAHGFRSDTTGKFDELQRICKAECNNEGILKIKHKKVILLTATPLNNRPDDLMNLLLLFQDNQNCTIDGIPNLKAFFAPKIKEYNKIMKDKDKKMVTDDVDKIYASIRNGVIDKVTVRRTRHNIMNDKDYAADLKAQDIIFPHILPPNDLNYSMDTVTSKNFFETLDLLSNEENPIHLTYARYRAVEFLVPDKRAKYKNAEHIGQTLAAIYRVHMVKRLESSFFAFKKSLHTLLQITSDMIKMFDEDKVIIAPDLNVKDLQVKGLELDQIIELALEKGYIKSDILFSADDFDPEFLEMLMQDKVVLERLNALWDTITVDPKFDMFLDELNKELFNDKINATGKLVIFSESVDTLDYLYKRLTDELDRNDVIEVTAKSRKDKEKTIRDNFDANIDAGSQKNDYNILLTSDVLAEGVNLHRSNVIVNYDSPWNATRLMQRIGRVNRIGSVAQDIYNYIFYPSPQGNKEIQLYKNALIKLQGFHSAFGEDAQIYSKEEIVKEFNLFDSNIKDSIDKKIELLRELRKLYSTNRELYHKIKDLPMKSRVMRDTGKHHDTSIVFVSSSFKTEFYYVAGDVNDPKPIDFLEAVKYLKADPEEKPVKFEGELHYQHVNSSLKMYRKNIVVQTDDNSVVKVNTDHASQVANKFLRTMKQISQDSVLKTECDRLIGIINQGKYANLPRELKLISSRYKNNRIAIKNDERKTQIEIEKLLEKYQANFKNGKNSSLDITDPQILISETFK